FVGMNSDVSLQSLAVPAQIPRDARVAIYDEDNLTVPAISHAMNVTNNLAEITTLLEGAGHTVDLLTEEDILNHELLTADYDVFIMINNVPKPSISKLVKEFWLGGGGLLTFNSAVSYLWYEGIIFPDQDYDVGYSNWWGYWRSDSQNITSRHSTMKDYHVNDTVYERDELWATSWEPKLVEGRGNDMIILMNNATQTDFISAFAIDNSRDGGNVVQLPGDGSSIPTDFESIILDSVEWLIPRPKGRIVFDLTHSPRLGVDEWDTLATIYWIANRSFDHFRTLATNHTYTFDKLYPSPDGNLTASRLAKYDVLVIVWPDLNYTTAEYAAVEEWVNQGGSLLVLGDRTGLGGPGNININMMLQNFDMSLGTTDVLNFASVTPETHVTLEFCSTLYMGYRNYLSVIGDAVTIWSDGTDAVVAGQEFGQGRAILSADMNIFDNGDLGEGSNARFALNALNWLTATHAEILVFTDFAFSAGYKDAVSLALNDLGLPYQLLITSEYIDDFLDSKSWELLIVSEVNYELTSGELDELYAYVDAGGNLLMSYYDMDAAPTHPLWSKLGVEYSSTLSGTPPMYIWDATHPIFTQPNNHSSANFTTGYLSADDGDAVTVLDGFTALAGSTPSVQNGTALIVVNSSSRQILYNSYLIDTCTGDEDDSTYMDSVELWQNEIVFMTTTPTTTAPIDPLDMTTLLIIGGAVLALIVIVALVLRRRSRGSTSKRKSRKKK
ncbi:MAG: DUF4350 domain-containing protein, partial [Candidatus Thorarchaeota archaeon]